jgi:hypothetical protein
MAADPDGYKAGATATLAYSAPAEANGEPAYRKFRRTDLIEPSSVGLMTDFRAQKSLETQRVSEVDSPKGNSSSTPIDGVRAGV